MVYGGKGLKMCGQFTIDTEDSDSIYRIVMDARQMYPDTYIQTGVIRPSNTVPVIAAVNNKIAPMPMLWGFPKWTGKGLVINAKSETAAEKPMFRKSMETMRCVIPSTGFFEWTHDEQKIKYRFRLPNESLLYMAGIYEVVDGLPHFVVLTTVANASMQEVHDRMPVVLKPELANGWIKDGTRVDLIINSAKTYALEAVRM